MYKDIALVLEGGGMRGAYSSGVLDIMHDNGLKFGGYAGTSAGATHICSYLSEQRERNMRIDAVHSQDPRYMGFKQLFKTGDYFPREFCYVTIPREIDPFDYAKFEENAKISDFYSVATNLETGEAEYLLTQEVDKGDGLECVRASASLPLMSKIVELRGMKLLDGGIGDSIPFEFMERKGFKKQVVILTQQEGFVKKPNSLIPLFKLMYRKYPKFVEAAATRHIRYNEALAKLKENEKAGKSFVFRPSEPFKISRIEKDASKLVELYKMGLKDGEANMPALKRFLEG